MPNRLRYTDFFFCFYLQIPCQSVYLSGSLLVQLLVMIWLTFTYRASAIELLCEDESHHLVGECHF